MPIFEYAHGDQGRFGSTRFVVDAATSYEIDDDAFVGAAGLTALAAYGRE